MTDRLTDADIKRGLALAEEATPGPWFYSQPGDFVCTSQLMDGDIVCNPPPENCDASFAAWPSNWVYIIDACNNYSAALRELTELRAERKAVLDLYAYIPREQIRDADIDLPTWIAGRYVAIPEHNERVDGIVNEVAKIRAEVARLTEELDAMKGGE